DFARAGKRTCMWCPSLDARAAHNVQQDVGGRIIALCNHQSCEGMDRNGRTFGPLGENATKRTLQLASELNRFSPRSFSRLDVREEGRQRCKLEGRTDRQRFVGVPGYLLRTVDYQKETSLAGKLPEHRRD